MLASGDTLQSCRRGRPPVQPVPHLPQRRRHRVHHGRLPLLRALGPRTHAVRGRGGGALGTPHPGQGGVRANLRTDKTVNSPSAYLLCNLVLIVNSFLKIEDQGQHAAQVINVLPTPGLCTYFTMYVLIYDRLPFSLPRIQDVHSTLMSKLDNSCLVSHLLNTRKVPLELLGKLLG